MNIQLSKRAAKVLQSLDKPLQTRISDGIRAIPKGDIKPLQGYAGECYRLRIGKYRIVYTYMEDNNGKTLYIMDIGSRGDIYK